jgi:hypothetical protein
MDQVKGVHHHIELGVLDGKVVLCIKGKSIALEPKEASALAIAINTAVVNPTASTGIVHASPATRFTPAAAALSRRTVPDVTKPAGPPDDSAGRGQAPA